MKPHLTEEEIILLIERSCTPQDANRYYRHLRRCRRCLDDLQYMVRDRALGNAGELPLETRRALVELGMSVTEDGRVRDIRVSGKRRLEPAARRRSWIYGVATTAAALILVTSLWFQQAGKPGNGIGTEITNPIVSAMTAAADRSLAVIPGTENAITTNDEVYRSGFVVNDDAASSSLLSLARRYEEGDASRDVVYWLLSGFLATGQLEAARDVADTALRLFPEDTQILTLLALVVYYQGELDEAESLLTSVLDLAPDDAVATLDLGVVLNEKGDAAGARAAFTRVTELQPETPLSERAEWLLKLDE